VVIDRAREINLVIALARGGARLGMAGLILLGASNSLQNAIAEGDTRTLSFHHAHTGEDITVTFKRDGRYDEAALKKLDWFMRDWRKEQATQMDPHLFDLLWEVNREVGGSQPIDVICGYRSPGTNAMLRARSSGVARLSQHITGKAIDFFIPGVPLAKIRAVGLHLQRGGVGFYPTSGSPFVHMDTASIRHWPSIAREELVKIFPDERTVQIPADGKPLRNYALALADVERQGHVPNGNSLEAARVAGLITTSQEQQAEAIGTRQTKPTLLARLFGFGRQQGKDEEPEDISAPAAKQARGPMVLASAVPKPKPVATARVVPMPIARPAQPVVVASAEPAAVAQPAATAEMTTASLSSRPASRNIWGDPIIEQRAANSPFEVASIDQVPAGKALSYAAESEPAPAAHVRPMGRTLPRLPQQATVLNRGPNTTVAVKSEGMSIGGQRYDSPWLRAVILTPTVSGFLSTARLSAVDPTWLHVLMEKPTHALMATFSADPSFDMTEGQFSGHAVVFLATATFAPQTTASLR
jgi:uncharacterized protein YcbK (DUF882 family)